MESNASVSEGTMVSGVSLSPVDSIVESCTTATESPLKQPSLRTANIDIVTLGMSAK